MLEMEKIVILCFLLGVTLSTSLDKCPTEEGDEPIYYPHEYNCSEFYQCAHGDLHLLSCPGNLYFNTQLNVCDQPYKVNCVTTTTPPPQPTTTTEKITTSSAPTTTTTSSPPTTTTTVAPETTTLPSNVVCDYDNTYYLKPYPDDCKKYIVCDYGKIQVITCPANKYFDKVDTICKEKDKAVCSSPVIY